MKNKYEKDRCPKCGVIHDVDKAGGHDMIEANKVLVCECKDFPDDEFCQEILKGQIPERSKEPKVYVLECLPNDNFDFRHEEMMGHEEKIMEEAESRGTVYSLSYFEECCNNDEINIANSFILIRPLPEENL